MPTPKDKPSPKPKKGKTPPKKRDMPSLLPPDPFAADNQVRAEAQAKCIAFGVERVRDCILEGKTLSQIAMEIGVGRASIFRWQMADPSVATTMNDARVTAARIWDEQAEELMAYAKDPFQFAKAKELAHHYRWRASCIAPKEFNPAKAGGPDANAVDPVAFLAELAEKLPD